MIKIRLLLGSLAVATVGLVATAAPSAEGAVPVAGTAPCSGTIQITQLHFVPPSVARGGTATAHVTAQNCTGKRQKASLTWLAQFMGNHRSGCPVIDPLARPATFAPHGTFKASLSYDLMASCTASRLQVTTRFTGSGGTQLAEKSADVTITK